MKPTKTPQEKFKAGLKRSGYDPDAGAKRLLDLIAKQKKEREEFESKYKSAYEGREMKTLKQIVEGTVVMSDFKLDKKGRKYKAHRAKMDREDMTNEGRAEDAMADLEKERNKDKSQSMSDDLEKFRERAKKGDSGKATSVRDMNPIDRAKWEKEKKDAGVNEEVEQVDELKKSTLRSYLKKAVPSHGDQEFISRAARDPEEKADAKRTADNRAVGIIRANRGLKSAHVATMKEDTKIDEGMQQTLRKYVPGYAKKQINNKMDSEKFGRRDVDKDENYNRYKKIMDKVTKEEFTGFSQYSEGFVNPYNEILEARGRPPGAATLAKRAAAAAAKPKHDEDEGEHYDADSGVEADQHIHVQLKKAADSDQKPFEVSFKNGKKHTVSQKVAKDILGATERLKPEHRKNVHDEIHQSYDNLVSVHRLVAGR